MRTSTFNVVPFLIFCKSSVLIPPSWPDNGKTVFGGGGGGGILDVSSIPKPSIGGGGGGGTLGALPITGTGFLTSEFSEVGFDLKKD